MCVCVCGVGGMGPESGWVGFCFRTPAGGHLINALKDGINYESAI